MITKPYPFLATIGVLPRTLAQALALLGTTEIAGAKTNPIFAAWEKELVKAGVKGVEALSDDAVPWCGGFHALTCLRGGKVPVDNPMWAMNWRTYGVEIARNTGSIAHPQLTYGEGLKASLGDTLVFQRALGGGKFAGHVGRYIAEDDTAFHVVGGNQSDAVTITRVEKARCVAVRRDVMTTPPASVRPYRVAATGALSKNEA